MLNHKSIYNTTQNTQNTISNTWNSLTNSIDFTSLKRFHKSLASEVLLPYCEVLFIWLCYRYVYAVCLTFMCILNYLYMYSRMSV